MKKKQSLVMDENEKDVAELLTKLGMFRNVAKTLIYMSQIDECCSSEIEVGTNLRQPEVSVAMKYLTDKGWVEKRNHKKEGKGRPMHIYSMAIPISSILDKFMDLKIKELDTVKKDLNTLKLYTLTED